MNMKRNDGIEALMLTSTVSPLATYLSIRKSPPLVVGHSVRSPLSYVPSLLLNHQKFLKKNLYRSVQTMLASSYISMEHPL